ncbi:hypothetical protein [Nocardia sp. NBC_00511]|uniref:phage tail termination protein n=1 Tax=Nocardia sp. NBC_00511 TaxID=2903591 RepID=UPI0030DFB557
MSLRFPDWWEGGFPDRELVVLDALQPILDLVDVLDQNGDPVLDNGQPRRPLACTWLPAKYTERLPLVRIFRGGGAADVTKMVDPAAVQVAVIAETRTDSWALMELCRQWLLSFKNGGTVIRADSSKTFIDSVEELVGPQQFPELSPEERLVQLNFRVVCRPSRPRTDYAKTRESLS